MSTNDPILRQMRDNWTAFQNDPQRKAAIEKFDHHQTGAELSRCSEHAASLVNFQDYKNSLQRLKAQPSKLDAQTEKAFAARFEDAIAVAQSGVASARKLLQRCTASGLDEVMERHARNVFWQLPHNPYLPQLNEKLKAMGMREPEISEHVTSLQDHDWDVLRLHGNDGTLSGLLDRADRHIPVMQRQLAAVRQHGLPTIEGHETFLEALVAIIVFVVIVSLMTDPPVIVAILTSLAVAVVV